MRSRLEDAGGLDVSAAFDAPPASLVDLVYDATLGAASGRTASVADFLAGLDRVEEELTAPDPVPQLDPLEARSGDVLEGGLTVVKRLGSGATAVALQVRRAAPDGAGVAADGGTVPARLGATCVLKVARDEGKRQRLLEEADRLAQLLSPPLRVGEHTALLLEFAGEPTLAEQLARGRLNLESLERYGTDLLDIVRALDAQGVMHRDIKPANLAVRPRPKDSELHLCRRSSGRRAPSPTATRSSGRRGGPATTRRPSGSPSG